MTLTLAVQAVRVLAIWMTGKAVGVELSPRPYYVMGPLLFLVMLVPFTINGLAVREAFFVSFLTQLGVSADRAFATGFLFFVVTIALALPGAAILAWQSLRPAGALHRPGWLTRPCRRRRHVQRAALHRAVPAERRGLGDGRRRPRLEGRDGGARRGALPRRAPAAAGEPRARAPAGTAASARRRAPYVLILNADAWAVGDGVAAAARLRREPSRRPPSSGRSSSTRTARCSARCAAFPTLWRLATEYFFLRKLAPRSQALNAFYAGGFDHDRVAEAEFVMGSAMLVRREAIERGRAARRGLLPLLARRPTGATASTRRAGRCCSTRAPSSCTSAAPRTAGRMYMENLRGHLRFLAKHRGPAEAERARRLLLAALRLRGVLFHGRARADVPRRRGLARLGVGAVAALRASRVSRRVPLRAAAARARRAAGARCSRACCRTRASGST